MRQFICVLNKSIGFKFLVDFSYEKAVALLHKFVIKGCTAENHHPVSREFCTLLTKFVHTADYNTTFLFIIRIGRQYYVGSSRQRSSSRQAFQRLAAHDNSLAKGSFLKVFQIAGKMGQELTVFSYSPVFVRCHNHIHMLCFSFRIFTK